MTTTYELYTNENGTPKAVEGKAPAIIERVEALETSVETLEGTLDNGIVTSVNGQTGDVTVDVGVTSVNGQTGAVTGLVRSVNGTVADASGNVSISTGITLASVCPDFTAGVSVTNGFVAPSTGWIIGYTLYPRDTACINYVNGAIIAKEGGDYADIQILVSNGDIYTCTKGASLTDLKFYPCKGV